MHDELSGLSPTSIGTHSREIEGRLMSCLLGTNGLLAIERPTIFVLGPAGPTTTIEGVQGWRNLALSPA